jgi:hypothetical protein
VSISQFWFAGTIARLSITANRIGSFDQVVPYGEEKRVAKIAIDSPMELLLPVCLQAPASEGRCSSSFYFYNRRCVGLSSLQFCS